MRSNHVLIFFSLGDGGQLSSNPGKLQRTYLDNTDACGLDEFMVVTNTISGRRDIVDLFYDNKIGIDVDVCTHQTIYGTQSNLFFL